MKRVDGLLVHVPAGQGLDGAIDARATVGSPARSCSFVFCSSGVLGTLEIEGTHDLSSRISLPAVALRAASTSRAPRHDVQLSSWDRRWSSSRHSTDASE